MIREREVTRRYLALVDGRPPAASGTIDAPLGRDRTPAHGHVLRHRQAARGRHPLRARGGAAAHDAAGRDAGDGAHPSDPRAHAGDRPSGVRRPPLRGVRGGRADWPDAPVPARARAHVSSSGARGKKSGASPNHPPICAEHSTQRGGSQCPEGQTDTDIEAGRFLREPPRFRSRALSCVPLVQPSHLPLSAPRTVLPGRSPGSRAESTGPRTDRHRAGSFSTTTKGNDSVGSGITQGAAGGRGPLRPPDAPLEPEDAPVHLRRAQRHPHHRPAEDRGPARARAGVRRRGRGPRRHGAVRGHQEAGPRHRQGSRRVVRHALRPPALARRAADQLPDREQAHQAPARADGVDRGGPDGAAAHARADRRQEGARQARVQPRRRARHAAPARRDVRGRPQDRGDRGARGQAPEDPDHRARGHQLRPGPGRLRDPRQRRRDPLVQGHRRGHLGRGRPRRAAASAPRRRPPARRPRSRRARSRRSSSARRPRRPPGARPRSRRARRPSRPPRPRRPAPAGEAPPAEPAPGHRAARIRSRARSPEA